MALGAQRKDLLQMVLRQGARMIAAGLALGLAGSLALGRVISTLLFGVKATDGPTYLAVALTLVLVSLFAAYVPARRAASVDPLVALRRE
jgi:putative ABC transport system permease protein